MRVWISTILSLLAWSQVNTQGVSWTQPANNNTEVLPAMVGRSSSVFCGGLTTFITQPQGDSSKEVKQTEEKPLESTNRCEDLQGKGNSYCNNSSWQKCNDTLRAFIELCANSPNSHHAFSGITSGVQEMNTDNSRWLDYREWLKSVLYLNSEDVYWCADAIELLSTFNYKDPKRGPADRAGGLAVVKFLLESKRCPDDSLLLSQSFVYTMKEWKQIWKDTVTSPTAVFDSTLPTIDEIGFGILRGPQGNAVAPKEYRASQLGLITTSSNPFTHSTTLELDLDQITYVRFEVYNELGQRIVGDGKGDLYEPGKHQFKVDGSNLTTGVYYARFSTARGEVKTVKLRHIK